MAILISAMCNDTQIFDRARKKAAQSNCKFFVAAFGFNKSGVVVIAKTNRPRFNRYGGGLHAERLVMQQAKKRGVVRIMICRVGKAGTLLPIEPCETCQKIANKLGIEINTVPYEKK